MSYHATQKPGMGLYECVDCGKTLFMADRSRALPYCPSCKSSVFIMAEEDDEFYGYIDNIEDTTVNRFISSYSN